MGFVEDIFFDPVTLSLIVLAVLILIISAIIGAIYFWLDNTTLVWSIAGTVIFLLIIIALVIIFFLIRRNRKNTVSFVYTGK